MVTEESELDALIQEEDVETIGGDVSYSLRDQMISYWVQPVDHNIRDVTVLFIQLRIQQRI